MRVALSDFVVATLADPLVRVGAAWGLVRAIQIAVVAISGHQIDPLLESTSRIIDAGVYGATGVKMIWRTLTE